MLLALFFASTLHLEVASTVKLTAIAVAVLYALAYGVSWSGRLPSTFLAYAALLDALLVGGLLGGSAGQEVTAGFLCMLALAVAHMCGGTRLALAAAVAIGIGWLATHSLGIVGLISSAVWRATDFRFALDTEATYRGNSIAALSRMQVIRIALASVALVALGGCVAFARALWERRRIARACAEVDALEAIVDCYAAGVDDRELWNTVSRSASQITGVRVLAAHASAEVVRLDDDASTVDAEVWRALRIPISARNNLIVHCIASGREAETDNLGDLFTGSEADKPPETLQRARFRYLTVPIRQAAEGAALVAIVSGNTSAVVDALRLVAERAGLVLKARQNQPTGIEINPSPAEA